MMEIIKLIYIYIYVICTFKKMCISSRTPCSHQLVACPNYREFHTHLHACNCIQTKHQEIECILKQVDTSLAIQFSPRQIALTKMTNETTKMMIEARRKKMIIRLITIWAQNPAIMFTTKRQSAANTHTHMDSLLHVLTKKRALCSKCITACSHTISLTLLLYVKHAELGKSFSLR